ncbi:S-layer homology domain-containing protein [Paenibacillus sp. cl123]|nr:S-layer homology domain-containing protein [Paenibacillus sp. cl123]
MRKKIAVLAVTSAVSLSLWGNQVFAAAFSDVPPSASYKTAIEEMIKQHVITGYSDHEFRPGQPVTRAELAKIFALAFHVQESAEKSSALSDVAESDWYRPYAEALVHTGAMKTENGKFNPNQPVTQEQLVQIAASLFHDNADRVKGILGGNYAKDQLVSRGEAVNFAYAAQQAAPVQIVSVTPLNAITLQITFSAPLPQEDVEVAKAKENFVFDNGLGVLNIPQLKSGSASTYIVPVTPQKEATTYSLSYKGQSAVTFGANTEKLALRQTQQIAADTFEVESSLEDGVADYGYIIAAYQSSRKGAFIVDENNRYNGKQYDILSSMRDKQVYITPENGETMIANYIPFTQATDGRQAPKFRLPAGQTFQPGVTYTVTSDWATIANSTFTAREIAPLAIASAEQVNETTINITLKQDPKDELFALRSVTLTPANGGAPLTAQYKLTSRKGATGTFELQNGEKLSAGTTYAVTPAGNWAAAADISLVGK